MLCGAHVYSLDPKLPCCCYCCTYFLAHAAAACLLHFSLSLYFSHLCIFSTKNKLAKLKGLLRVQPNGLRKDEPQSGFISERYYEVQTVLVSLYFGFQTCVRQESSVIRHLRSHQRLPHPTPSPPHALRNTLFNVVVSTLKAVPISIQYLLTSVLVQLTRMPSVVTG